VFEDEPLATALERMNRYSDLDLQVGDAKAGAVRISGVFQAGDIGAFVEGVSSVYPVRTIRRGQTLTFVGG
jgi:transmembrane sensor